MVKNILVILLFCSPQINFMESEVAKGVAYFYFLSLLQHFRSHEDSSKVEALAFCVKLVRLTLFAQVLALLETEMCLHPSIAFS